ncbi:hypothetical protein Tco_0429396 [Tanacetum coccineum]
MEMYGTMKRGNNVMAGIGDWNRIAVTNLEIRSVLERDRGDLGVAVEMEIQNTIVVLLVGPREDYGPPVGPEFGDADRVVVRDQIEGIDMEKEGGMVGNTDYDLHTENCSTISVSMNTVNINDNQIEEFTMEKENKRGTVRIKENDKLEFMKTYATTVKAYELKFDTSLSFKQTEISNDGKEIVIVDDELVAKGCSK